MNFQKTVMTVALVLFIIIMAVVGVLMNNAKKKKQFPPEIGVCPDYWELKNIGKEDNVVLGCYDENSVGNGTGNPDGPGSCADGINFRDVKYTTKLQKCKAAKACGVEWDGITNIGIC